jgi:hypothetical protein
MVLEMRLALYGFVAREFLSRRKRQEEVSSATPSSVGVRPIEGMVRGDRSDITTHLAVYFAIRVSHSILRHQRLLHSQPQMIMQVFERNAKVHLLEQLDQLLLDYLILREVRWSGARRTGGGSS